jgi:hypothetical protein
MLYIVLYYFVEAGKIWPKDLNWSEEIALILLNKFNYSIENTLFVLKDPKEEMLTFMKGIKYLKFHLL